MRIDPHQLSGISKNKQIETGKEAVKSVPFHQVLRDSQPKPLEEKLSRLLKDIDAAGERLVKSATVRDLTEYKNHVKSFMEEAVKHGLTMENREGFNQRGRTKRYKMIAEVDEKLLELTNDVLQKEQKGLDMLERIGQIKGMLVNMYL